MCKHNLYVNRALPATGQGEIIPIFFATDNAYAPYLCVALRSLIDHKHPMDEYRVYILVDTIARIHRDRLFAMATDTVSVEFVSVAEKLDRLGVMLHLRDYYTRATYYRFFIPALFPQYGKGIYLDCDILLMADLGEFWRFPLEDRIVGAAPEEVMLTVDVFGRYTEAVLGIPREEYFSAGVMLMNLKKMRETSLESRFVDLIGRRKFSVTQDQDYLNVLCHGDAVILPLDWNKTACPGEEEPLPKLAHYKINWKPWHYEGVRFEKPFWETARRTDYYGDIRETLRLYTEADKAEDARQYKALVALAEADIAAYQ